MRSLLFALLAALPCTAMPGFAQDAQQPLMLRIRPNGAPLPEGGFSGQGLSETEVAARARTQREAVWQRAERRARIAIASVCTGCLPPAKQSEIRAAEPAGTPDPAATPPDRIRSADASPPDPRPQTEGDL